MSGNNKYDGFLLTEMTVALTVLGTLLVAFALSLHAFAKFNRYQLERQRCIAAAQAHLDSIDATGKPIPTEDFERLWPRLSFSIKESAGTAQWEGMKLVEVTTKTKSFRHEVKVQLSKYILADKNPSLNAGLNPQINLGAKYLACGFTAGCALAITEGE